MKAQSLIVLSLFLAKFLFVISQNAHQLATYTFTNHRCATPVLTPTYYDSRVWLSAYQLDNVNCTSGTNYLTTNNWTDSMASLTWRIAPDNCENILLSSLRFQHKGSISAGNAVVELRSNKDNYTSVLGTWKLLTAGKLQTDSIVFQNPLVVEDTTEFRWFVTGILSKTATYRHDNILLSGAIVEEPPFIQYRDFDNDGFGDALATISDCKLQNGYVTNWNDCDDENDNIHPGAFDVTNNNVDENCDGEDTIASLVENLEEVVEILPNPGSSYCMFHWSSRIKTKGYLTITNSIGQVVYCQIVNSNLESLLIPTFDWTNGVYQFNLLHEQMNKQYLWIKI